jgi:hypothetical protein
MIVIAATSLGREPRARLASRSGCSEFPVVVATPMEPGAKTVTPPAGIVTVAHITTLKY